MTGILESALEHRRLGLRLVALRGKAAFMKRWQELTLTENAVREFARSGCNFGAITGEPLVVFDTDSEEAEAWVRAKGIESSIMVRSGGGGLHRYFAAPDGAEVRGKQGAHRIVGLDVKGWHGYIVLPGSIHPQTGGPYEYVPGKELRSLAMLPPFDPAWLVEKPRERLPKPHMHQTASRNGAIDVIHDIRAYVLGIPSEQGKNGNKGLMRVCYLLAERYDFNTALGYAEWWNSITPKPQWNFGDIERALTSAYRLKEQIRFDGNGRP